MMNMTDEFRTGRKTFVSFVLRMREREIVRDRD